MIVGSSRVLLTLVKCCQLLLLVAASPAARAHDPASAPTINGQCQSGQDVVIRDNDEPDLCEALRVQATKAAEHNGTFCSLPFAEAELGLSRPDWSPVEPSTIEPLLRQNLPLFGWDTRGVQNLLQKERPQSTRAELLAEHWQRYGPAMMQVLRSGNDLLQTAVVDVDNDGSVERVYRTAVLRPIDKARPELGWRTLPCNLASNAPAPAGDDAVVPYRALFFEQAKQPDMGIMAHFDKIENHDLFLFKGRSYLAFMGPSSISADRTGALKLPNAPREAFFLQVCSIAR
jgi:hypothetical protein